MICLFMSSVSAVDTNTTHTLNHNEISEVEVSSAGDNSGLKELENSNSVNLKATNDTAGLTDSSSNTFQDIKTEINSASPGDTITLNGTYLNNENGQITINKENLTIIGTNNCILDAQKQSGIFKVSASGVTIKNITFINGNTDETVGGAIYWMGNNGVLEDCVFTDNQIANGIGGAIYFDYNADNASVRNCNFTANTASNSGGAIYWNANNGVVNHCTFTNNKAVNSGAISWYGESGVVGNSTFISNSASNRTGAIYWSSTAINGIVDNCIFTANTATDCGAVNWVGKSGALKDSAFTSNTAGKNSGAITWSGESGVVDNCTFTNNTGKNGNAINWEGNSGVVGNCTFKTDTADSNGGAIYLHEIASGSYSFKLINNTEINNEGDQYFILNNEKWNLYLSNNKLVSPIYNKGKIISKTNITCLNNNTQNVYDSDIILDAVIQDDNQNIIILDSFTFKLNNNNVPAQFNNKHHANTDYTLPDAGTYLISWKEDSSILNNTSVYRGTVIYKINTTITVTDKIDVKMCDSADINARLTPADAGNLTYTSSNPSIVIIENGTIKAVGVGSAIINVTYAGNEFYTPSQASINVTVSLKNTSIKADDMNMTIGENKTISYTAFPEGLNITYTPDNSGVVSVENGVVIALKEGTAKITVTINGNEEYSENSTTITVNVTAVKIIPIEIIASPLTSGYNENKNLIITVIDNQGNPVSGVNVTVKLKNLKTYTTDNNGQIKVSTKGLAPKVYTAKITVNSDDTYSESTLSVNVTIKKTTPKFKVTKKLFKKSTKTKKYRIILKDKTGKKIKKAKVYLRVKGKTYKAKTNSKGSATFKITKLNKKGTFKGRIKFKGNKYYNRISKKVKIKVINKFKTIYRGSKDKATVKEIQRALKSKGYYLTYNNHYLKIDGKYHIYTYNAVKQFQHDKGLKETGNVNEKTAKKLGII